VATKDEIEQENAELREQVTRLEQELAARDDVSRETSPEPRERPPLSAGEMDDLINAGVTRSPFNGETLNALDLGIEPGNPDAQRRAERERSERRRMGASGG
jgi:hypothetical protein